MTGPRRLLGPMVIAFVLATPAFVRSQGPLAGLIPEQLSAVRIQLNAAGENPGFSVEIAGDDPAVRELVEVIRVRAEPASDHRCSNRGSIRFFTADGDMLVLGLLPGHTEGSYELRVYRVEELVAVYRIDRAAFLTAIGELGVPLDHPSFQQ